MLFCLSIKHARIQETINSNRSNRVSKILEPDANLCVIAAKWLTKFRERIRYSRIAVKLFDPFVFCDNLFFRSPPHREKACCDMCSRKTDHIGTKNNISFTRAAIFTLENAVCRIYIYIYKTQREMCELRKALSVHSITFVSRERQRKGPS